jgi:CzcA family heavy metal efflux pump
VIAWLKTHQRSVLFLLAAAALGGVFAAIQLPVGLFPTIDFPRVQVSVESGDRPVERMVVEVTRPLEQALRGVPDVLGMRSTSSRGSAEISVNFGWGTDMVAAQLQVESAISRILPELPAGTVPSVRRMDPTVFPVLGLTLNSNTRDLVSLRDFAFYRLRPMLTSVPGVAQVEVLGGELGEYQILIDSARLQAAGLAIQDVAAALAANNVVTAVGRLEDRHRLYLTLADNRLANGEDIGSTVLKSGPRGAIQLRDVAEVRNGIAPIWTRVTAGGRDAVLINIRQSRGANAPALTRAVHDKLAALGDALPADIKVGFYYDQSELVLAAASSVRDAILIGAVLAGIVLLLFLRDAWLTLVIAVVLPTVLAVTALALSMFGMTFNIMTLGGMAAAVGLVVDDAVVIVEHMVRRRHEASAESRSGAAQDSLLPAAAEMLRPLLGSSMATVVVFVPLAFLSGVTGGFFKALAVTMAAALVVSFGVAMFAVPVLTNRLLIRRPVNAGSLEGGFFSRLRERYARLAESALRYPRRAAIAAAMLLVIGGLAFLRLASGFMPHMDEGGFVLDYFAAPGTSLAETDRLLRQVESLIQQTPEVANYSRRTGLQLGGGLTEANQGDMFIRLKRSRHRNIEEIMEDLRGRVESQVPGLNVETTQLMEDLIGDLTAVPQPVEVKLFGADIGVLRHAAPQIAAKLATLRGLVEIRDGQRVAGDAIEVHVDRVRAAFEGLDPDAVIKQAGALVGGIVIGQIQAGEKLVDVRLWSPLSLRDRVEALPQLRLRAPDGHALPLSRVADIHIATGQPQIMREDLEQMIPVTARLEGRDLGSAMKDVRRSVAAMQLPRSIRVEYGGLYAEQQKSFRGLAAVFGAAVLLVVVLLLYLYERWAVVGAILATVLLSVAAVFVGLWLTRTELNISAMMGMTMIVGIVTEIAVFYFAELDTGVAADRIALVRAGRYRLRPILMTSLIAMLALMPLALGIGTGAAMQTPLAIAIISGLAAAVPLVLVMMPVVYAMFAAQGRSGARDGNAGEAE